MQGGRGQGHGEVQQQGEFFFFFFIFPCECNEQGILCKGCVTRDARTYAYVCAAGMPWPPFQGSPFIRPFTFLERESAAIQIAITFIMFYLARRFFEKKVGKLGRGGRGHNHMFAFSCLLQLAHSLSCTMFT